MMKFEYEQVLSIKNELLFFGFIAMQATVSPIEICSDKI